jgi:hypothetical protein
MTFPLRFDYILTVQSSYFPGVVHHQISFIFVVTMSSDDDLFGDYDSGNESPPEPEDDEDDDDFGEII